MEHSRIDMTTPDQDPSEFTPLATRHTYQPVIIPFDRLDAIVAPPQRVKPSGLVMSSPRVILDVRIVWYLFVEQCHGTGRQRLEGAPISSRTEGDGIEYR